MLASSRMTGLVEYFAAPFFARPRAGMPPKNNLAETARIYPRSNHICHKEIYKKARYSAARGLAALPCKHIQGQNILQQAPAAIYVRDVEDAAPYQPLKVPH